MQFQPTYPFDVLTGTVKKQYNSRGELMITRQKTFSNNAKGPKECYPLRSHKGEWSEKCQANRAVYSTALKRLYAEARDPEKAAEWQAKFARYNENPFAEEWAQIPPNKKENVDKPKTIFGKTVSSTPKIYPTIRGFMLALIRAELTANSEA